MPFFGVCCVFCRSLLCSRPGLYAVGQCSGNWAARFCDCGFLLSAFPAEPVAGWVSHPVVPVVNVLERRMWQNDIMV